MIICLAPFEAHTVIGTEETKSSLVPLPKALPARCPCTTGGGNGRCRKGVIEKLTNVLKKRACEGEKKMALHIENSNTS